MKKERIKAYLDTLFPDARCELIYHNQYELLIAIVLSAQTTDKMVNKVTPLLFKQYPSFEKLKDAAIVDVIDIIAPLGLSKRKASNIINLAAKVSAAKKIPNSIEQLKELDGVGQKTATLFLAIIEAVDGFAVDTHVKRVATRLGLTKEKDPSKISGDLANYFAGFHLAKLHHQFVLFGRYFCKATNPKCENCQFFEFCCKK